MLTGWLLSVIVEVREMHAQIHKAELEAGLQQLDDKQARLDRISRFIGVTLKEPFATPLTSDLTEVGLEECY